MKQNQRPSLCAECETNLTLSNTVRYNETFVVCGPCEEKTKADWQERKAELKAEGFDPDACTFIEESL